MSELKKILARHPFWKGLPADHLEFLQEASTLAQFGIGQMIFREGEPADRFYLVRKGEVDLETFIPARGVMKVDRLEEGQALGWSWLFPPYRWRFGARAAGPTEVIAMEVQSLRERAEEDHEFGCELWRRVSALVVQRLEATRSQLLEFYGANQF